MAKVSKREIREPIPEKKELGERVVEKKPEEKREKLEKREVLTEEEKIIRKKLEKEIEMMKLSPKMQDDARQKAQQIKNLDGKGKIKRLLDIAEEKGVGFAVETARDMKDPYILDILHDILAKDQLYKKFEK